MQRFASLGKPCLSPEIRLKVRDAFLAQTPQMRLSDIDAGFGISESSGAAKLAAIRKMLRIHPLDHEWTLPSRLDDYPIIWMLTVNGFMMDVRYAPREVQEIAFNKGLIPHISAARRVSDAEEKESVRGPLAHHLDERLWQCFFSVAD